MPETPVILKKSLAASSRLFRIESLEVRFSNGVQRNYERLARGNSKISAVLIVPMLDNDTVLLVREYSAGIHRYELGLPKGKTESGETFIEAANRKLKEETGYGAKSLTHLSSLSAAPAYIEYMTEIIVAQDLYPEKLTGDEPEELEVVPWSLNRLAALLASGQCTEARSIAALFLAREYLNKANSF